MESSITSPSWVPFLVAYLAGAGDIDRLYGAARKPLLRVVARLAPLLPEDLRDDVVQQVFIRLIETPPKYDPGQCSASTLMYGLLRNAIRQVQATFAPPGQKTRATRSEDEPQSSSLNGNQLAERLTVEDEVISQPVGLAPSPRWTAAQTHAIAESRELLGRLPHDLGSVTWLVHGLGYSISDAARIIGKSRFSVARSLKQVQGLTQLRKDAPRQPHEISAAA
jgi:RNA polymerase sigma factor (sigma-70 family)